MRVQKLMRLGKSNTECLSTRLRCIYLYEHWASFYVNSIQPKLIGILVDLLCSSVFFLFLSEYHKKYIYNSQWESARKRSESQESTEPDTVLRFVRLWERWKFLSIPHIGVFFVERTQWSELVWEFGIAELAVRRLLVVPTLFRHQVPFKHAVILIV